MSNRKFFYSKKNLLAVFCLALIFVFGYSKTTSAFGIPFIDLDGSWTVIPFLKLGLNVSMLILSMAETVFQWIIVPDNMTSVINNSAIYEMWRFVRDFFNTVLIMILLFSAFATIFQASNNYNYKKVLVNLIIMALLVNFSYPISRFIIDLSNVFMYGFLNQLGGDGSFIAIIKLSGINNFFNSPSSDITFLAATTIFTFMFAITLLVIAVLLVIRTIALAIFVVFSPIAFLGSTQPGTDLANAASGWWKEFMKYCFAGPIMVFMLILANKMMVAVSSASGGLGNIAKVQSDNAALSSFITSISFFVLPLVILWMGIIKAQSSGIAGANVVVGHGMKAMKWAGKNMTGYNATKWGAKALAHKAERGLAKGKHTWWMSPTAFKAAWKENQAELDRKAFKGSTGGWRDKINSIPLIGDGKSKYKDAATQNNIATKEKELEATTTDVKYLWKEFLAAENSGDTEKMAAALRIMAKSNDLNDFMADVQEKDFNAESVKEEIYTRLRKAGMSENDASKQLSDMGEVAYGKGNFQMYGMGEFDVKTGEYKKTSKEKQLALSLGKIKNVKAQTKMDLMHWGSLVDIEIQKDSNGEIMRDADGKALTKLSDDLSDFGKAGILGQLTETVIKNIDRVRDDLIDTTYAKIDKVDAYADELEKGDPSKGIKANQAQANIIRKFANEVRIRKGIEKKPEPKVKVVGGSYSSGNKVT